MILIILFFRIRAKENIDVIFDTNIEDIGLVKIEYIFRVSENLIVRRYVFDSRPNKSPFSMKQIFKGILLNSMNPRKL